MLLMNLQEKTFTHNGITIAYWVFGKGKPLLFLSGGIRALTYQKTVEVLARDYCVYLVDLPGFGKSTVPHDVWTLTEYADYIDAFTQSHKLKQFPVIGHSLGGGIGLALCAKSTNVSKLIIIGGAGITPTINKFHFYFNLAIQKSVYDFLYAKNKRIQAIIFNNGLSTIHENIWYTKHILKIANVCIFTDFALFNEVTVPVSLVWGKDDELFSVQCAQKMKKLLSNSTLEIVQGNHDWCLLDPERFYTLIKKYL